VRHGGDRAAATDQAARDGLGSVVCSSTTATVTDWRLSSGYVPRYVGTLSVLYSLFHLRSTCQCFSVSIETLVSQPIDDLLTAN
jgi:hypothetical protein